MWSVLVLFVCLELLDTIIVPVLQVFVGQYHIKSITCNLPAANHIKSITGNLPAAICELSSQLDDLFRNAFNRPKIRLLF